GCRRRRRRPPLRGPARLPREDSRERQTPLNGRASCTKSPAGATHRRARTIVQEAAMNAGGRGTSTARVGGIGKTTLYGGGALFLAASVLTFASKARAGGAGVAIPTGATGPSYVPVGMGKFNQPMPRFDVLPRLPV